MPWDTALEESKLATKPESGIPPEAAEISEDVALICGRTPNGKGLQVVRKRQARVEAGILQPLEEGKPITGEVIQLRQRGRSPVCDVEVLLPEASASGSSAAQLKGPGQVASDTYRKNWDSIYRGKTRETASTDKKLLN